MELFEYLHRNQLKIKEFAEQIEFDRSYVGRVITGKVKPGKRFIKAVKEVTDGQVTFEETENENDNN